MRTPAEAIEKRLADQRDAAMKVGTVTGTSGTKVIVSVENGSVTIARLASYTPTVGDVVIILTALPGAWIVLGKPA